MSADRPTPSASKRPGKPSKRVLLGSVENNKEEVDGEEAPAHTRGDSIAPAFPRAGVGSGSSVTRGVPVQCSPGATGPTATRHLPLGLPSRSSANVSFTSAPAPDSEPALPALPAFHPVSAPHFKWGDRDGSEFVRAVDLSYAEVVHWRRNIFLVPLGKSGKEFAREMTRLLRAFAEKSALESIALRALMVMPLLLLQKPSMGSKSIEHAKCLERRLALWKAGDLNALLFEGRTIQQHLLHRSARRNSPGSLPLTFSKLMTTGKVHSALRLLDNCQGGGPLPLEVKVDGELTVRDVLISKHPPSRQPPASALLTESEQRPPVHPVLFDSIKGSSIRTAVLATQGGAGPSGVDAAGWRRLCTMFHGASNELCEAIALVARRLCTEHVDPAAIEAFTACRLIPLDKRPGVRPIGVCETLRRIVGKAIMAVVKADVQAATGALQLCAGQRAGIEAAIHSMQGLYHDVDTEGVLLVDAKNAFNSLNRQAALRNVAVLCPALSTVLTNTYRSPSHLFVDGKTILSEEGTTQGDPLAMAMYAVASVPLIRKVVTPTTTQAWYADDATAGGRLAGLRVWWDRLGEEGPHYGYEVNPPKSWLVVKPDRAAEATKLFAGTGVQITATGARHLGAALGTPGFADDFITKRVTAWVDQMERLALIAQSEPHAAYCAFTRGLVSRWVFTCRTTPEAGMSSHLERLEKSIRENFIPALLGRDAPADQERKLLALPARHGGMALVDPTTLSDQHNLSVLTTTALVRLILQQSGELGPALAELEQTKQRIARAHRQEIQESAKSLVADMSPATARRVALAAEKGASAWLTTLPIARHDFHLSKADFRDAACLRYGWPPPRTPGTCACGAPFSTSHALSCPRGGFPTVRHNELRDLCAGLLSEVCHNVSTEPHLQPIEGEQFSTAMASTADGARCDIAANGFWGGRFERTLFDVRVFDPNVPSNLSSSIPALYRRCERNKRNVYEQRVRQVEHASFAPLVWSVTGGASPGTAAFLKRLALLLAERKEESYSSTIHWLRCRVNFALLRSSITCIRGHRSAVGRPVSAATASIPLALAEGRSVPD